MSAMDAFEELGLERTPVCDPARLRAAYQAKMAGAHPDAGGSLDRSQRLAEALAILQSPSRCAWHWLELHGHPRRPGLSEMSDALATLFTRLAAALDACRAAENRHHSAGTNLAKALAARELLSARDELEACLQDVQAQITRMESLLRDAGAPPADTAVIASCAEQLGFLEKWQSEARAALARMAGPADTFQPSHGPHSWH